MPVSLISQEWSPSHNLKSLRKKQLATREAMARQTVVSDAELSIAESSVIRCVCPCLPLPPVMPGSRGELDKCPPRLSTGTVPAALDVPCWVFRPHPAS